MIKELSLDEINKKAPYYVTQNMVTKAYHFVSDYGVSISILVFPCIQLVL